MATRAPIPAKTTDDLFKALSVLSRTVDRILHARAVEEALDHSLSSSKMQVLRLLGQSGGHTSSRIALYLGVSRPSVTHMTDGMEREGLIARFAGQQDGRESILELTEEGRRCFSAVRRRQGHLLRSALRFSGPSEAEAWTQTLLAISKALAQADRAFEGFCLQCGAHADGTCVLVGGNADCPFLGLRQSGRRSGKGQSKK